MQIERLGKSTECFIYGVCTFTIVSFRVGVASETGTKHILSSRRAEIYAGNGSAGDAHMLSLDETEDSVDDFRRLFLLAGFDPNIFNLLHCEMTFLRRRNEKILRSIKAERPSEEKQICFAFSN